MPSLSASLRVTITGQGARTLVLGDGFATEQSIWAPIVEALAADYRVVTFDPAGSNTTPEAWQPSRHRRLEGYAEDLLGIIEGLGVDRVAYIGHSFSGMTGVLAACAEPSLFERMVLIGASARRPAHPGAANPSGCRRADRRSPLTTSWTWPRSRPGSSISIPGPSRWRRCSRAAPAFSA